MGAMIRDNVIAALPRTQSIRISPFWYALGNILPDMSWLPVTHPHYAEHSAPFIRKKLSLSLLKHRRHALDQYFVSPVFSLRLGIVSHYLCDFFCVAHQGSGIDGARRHLEYEHEMRDFFYEHRSEVEALCRFQPTMADGRSMPATAESLHDVFETWHETYRRSQFMTLQEYDMSNHSVNQRTDAFVTDIRTAIACCTCLFCAFAAPAAVLIEIESLS